MLIDHTHRKWFFGSLAGLAVATAVYIPYSLRSPQGPRGGSALGLAYGITGFLRQLPAYAVNLFVDRFHGKLRGLEARHEML